jgi:hypothetical protein
VTAATLPRLLLLALSFVAPPDARAQEPVLPEGNAFMRTVFVGARPQDDALNDYAYDVEEIREKLDKKGGATSRASKRFQVYFVQKRPVRRLVSKDGVPLSAREQAEVDRKAEAQARAIAEGRTVSERPGIRLSLMADSFDFETIGREIRDGRATLALTFEPRPGAKAAGGNRTDALSRILHGRILVDETDRRVALIEASTIAGESAGVSTGVKIGDLTVRMEFVAVEDHVWLPRRVETVAAGRAFFFRTFRVRQTTIYSNYRKFKVDTDEKPIG